MNELAIFEQIKDEPLALIVLGGVVLIKIIEYLIRYAPRMFSYLFTKEKKMPFWKWQNFIAKNIDEIKDDISKLFATVSAHEYLLDKTSEGTLENQLFMDNQSNFIRLKAFRRLLAMKRNGRILECGFKLLLELKGKDSDLARDLWRDVLDTNLGITIVDEEYYNAKLKEISTRIFDGFV